MTLTSDAQKVLTDDHYAVMGDRNLRPRDTWDTPFDVPSITDWVCASDNAPWPCDTALALDIDWHSQC